MPELDGEARLWTAKKECYLLVYSIFSNDSHFTSHIRKTNEANDLTHASMALCPLLPFYVMTAESTTPHTDSDTVRKKFPSGNHSFCHRPQHNLILGDLTMGTRCRGTIHMTAMHSAHQSRNGQRVPSWSYCFFCRTQVVPVATFGLSCASSPR